MDRLGPEAMLILWSAPVQTYSRDVDYEYRQDSNLYYLTGIDQEETTLVLMPGNATRKEILFIKQRDPVREHWHGRLLSKEEATAQSGIDHVYLTSEFEHFVSEIFSQRAYGVDRYAASSEFKTFFTALGSGKARLALVLDPKPQLNQTDGTEPGVRQPPEGEIFRLHGPGRDELFSRPEGNQDAL